MKCSKCGFENTNKVKFCTECGTKLVTEIEKSDKISKTKKTLKETTKKEFKVPVKLLIIIAIAIVFIIGLVFGYNTLKEKYNGEAIALDYVEAYIENDYKTLNKLTDGSDYKMLDTNEEENIYITELSVLNSTPSTDGKNLLVVVQYKTNEIELPMTANVELVVDGKNLVLFDNYKVVSGPGIASDFSIYVPTDSEVTIGDVKLEKSLIDEEKSDSDADVYVIDNLYAGSYQIDIKLSNGLELVREASVESYGYIRTDDYYLKASYLAEDQLDKLEKEIETIVTTLVTAGLTDEAEDVLTEKLGATIKSGEYEDLMRQFYDNLTDIKVEVTKYNFEGLEFDGSEVTINADVYFEYEGKDSEGDTEDDNDGLRNMQFVFDYNGEFKLIELANAGY